MKFPRRKNLNLLYLREGWRRFSKRRAASSFSRFLYSFGVPDRLIVAPTDLRAIDPYVAEEIFAGRFPLAGRVLDTDGKTPFVFELPSKEFANRLHSFSWLRHVRATKSDAHCANSRAIVDDWISIHGTNIRGIAWEPDIIAQRVIAWLSHSPIVLKGAEIGFYKRYLKNLAFQIAYLKRISGKLALGEPRLRVHIALALASISLPVRESAIRKAAKRLDREIDLQILPDGGHVSRNPRVILELLLDLLPLRQTYVNLGHDVPARLIPAIDRMYPALRFFRHNSGELALFNGATSTLANELLSVLRYDETAGSPFKSLPHSHYHRLTVNNTNVIVDTGVPLSQELSVSAHFGCLSFEMSSGQNRYIINSGAPRFAGEHFRQLARVTAAHSAVVLNDTSTFQMASSAYLGPIVVSGISEIRIMRHDVAHEAEGLTARHDGYLQEFKLRYERDIQITAGGATIRGRDRFLTPDGKDPRESDTNSAVARFHIHPAIAIRQVTRNEVSLMAADGETWSFSCIDAEITIADDVFFADPSGIRRSQQLEIAFIVGDVPEIQWVMELVR